MSFRSELDLKFSEFGLSAYDRPFTCDGIPDRCEIFIVGSNPARPLRQPFASYWSDDRRFNKRSLLDDIEPWTPTRRNIEHVAREAGYDTTLDANIWVKDSPRETQLAPEHRDTRLFEWMFWRLKPKVVLAHGDHAKDFFEFRLECKGVKRNSGAAHAVKCERHEFLLICSDHLSYQTSEVKAKAIGRKLRAAHIRASRRQQD